MIIDIALTIFFVVGFIIFVAGLIKITWNISKTGVDIMEFFGNIGRPGTSREQFGKKTNKKTKWNKDGSKEI